MNKRTAFLILCAAALAASFANDVIARGGLGLGREGMGLGKLGAAAKQGSNGIAPVSCGTGVIDLSTGCSLPIALGLVP